MPAKLWGARDVAGSVLKVGLTTRGRGPVTDVVSREPRLDRLPVITCWPEDGGPFVTLPLVYTESPRGHGHNLAMYRLHVYDEASTGMHWQIGKGGGFHYAEAEAAGQALPATVMLGGPPALILSAIAPLPENVPELLLASLIAGQRLARVPGPFRHPHPIVASCEFALLGEVAAVQPATRRAVRRPLRLLLAAARLPGVPCPHRRPSPRRHLPGDGRRQAAAGGLLHRRPAPGAAVAALPAGDAGGGEAVVLRRDRLPFPGRCRRQAALPARGHGQRLPHPGRGPAVAAEVPAPDRSGSGRHRFSCHARARAGPHRPANRSLRLRRTCRWTPSTTPARR